MTEAPIAKAKPSDEAEQVVEVAEFDDDKTREDITAKQPEVVKYTDPDIREDMAKLINVFGSCFAALMKSYIEESKTVSPSDLLKLLIYVTFCFSCKYFYEMNVFDFVFCLHNLYFYDIFTEKLWKEVMKKMAYAQWVQIEIQPINFVCKVNDARLSWGKFYSNGNKDKEIAASDINGKSIGAETTYSIYACGRSDSASGTEGSINLYDGDKKIAKLYWDCPWGSKTNTFQAEKLGGAKYMMETSDYNHSGGALGLITVKIAKF